MSLGRTHEEDEAYHNEVHVVWVLPTFEQAHQPAVMRFVRLDKTHGAEFLAELFARASGLICQPLVDCFDRETLVILVRDLEDAPEAALTNYAVNRVLVSGLRVCEDGESCRILGWVGVLGLRRFLFRFLALWIRVYRFVHHRLRVDDNFLSPARTKGGGSSGCTGTLDIEEEAVHAVGALRRLLGILGPLRSCGVENAELIDIAGSRGEAVSEVCNEGGETVRVDGLGRLKVLQPAGVGGRVVLEGRIEAGGRGRRCWDRRGWGTGCLDTDAYPITLWRTLASMD